MLKYKIQIKLFVLNLIGVMSVPCVVCFAASSKEGGAVVSAVRTVSIKTSYSISIHCL